MYPLYKVIWKRLYSVTSGADGGTLFQLRSLINRRNVRKGPSDDVNSSVDFLMTVIEGHILAAVMEVLGMSSLTDEPSSVIIPDLSQDQEPTCRKKILLHSLQKVIDKHVDISSDIERNVTLEDNVYEYANEVLSLGLLLMEFTDAIKEGDGTRIIRCW